MTLSLSNFFSLFSDSLLFSNQFPFLFSPSNLRSFPFLYLHISDSPLFFIFPFIYSPLSPLTLSFSLTLSLSLSLSLTLYLSLSLSLSLSHSLIFSLSLSLSLSPLSLSLSFAHLHHLSPNHRLCPRKHSHWTPVEELPNQSRVRERERGRDRVCESVCVCAMLWCVMLWQ